MLCFSNAFFSTVMLNVISLRLLQLQICCPGAHVCCVCDSWEDDRAFLLGAMDTSCQGGLFPSCRRRHLGKMMVSLHPVLHFERIWDHLLYCHSVGCRLWCGGGLWRCRVSFVPLVGCFLMQAVHVLKLLEVHLSTESMVPTLPFQC